MGTVGRLAENNLAGGCKVQLIPISLVTAVPLAVRGTISTAISTAVGAEWETHFPTLFTQQFAEVMARENGHRLSRATLGWVIPKDRALYLASLWDFQRERFLVLNFDKNGTMKLMGTKEEPATVTLTLLDHGATPADRNRYEVRATVARREACPFYLADPPAISTPGGACPTWPEMAPGLTWEEIEAELDAGQLAAAEAALCDCDTLLELMTPETGGALWALMTGPQQAAALVAAGVVEIDEIDDTEPYGSLIIEA